MIEMTDGVKLFTSVWILKGKENETQSTVIDRSPYGPTTETVADAFLPLGFAAVMQNMRGTGLSEGEFTLWHNEASDAATTMAWIAAMPWSNQIVFATGASADGINAYASLLVPQPYLKGMFPFWATGRAYQLVFENGAYREALVTNWLDSIHAQRPWTASYVETIFQNEAYSPWWESIELSNCTGLSVPGVHWAGLYDIFLQRQLDTFECLQSGTGSQRLVIGTRGHCFFEDYRKFPDDRFAEVFSYELAGELFLKQSGLPYDSTSLNTITLYVMGSNETDAPGSYWTTLPAFPQAVPNPFYLAPGGELARMPPSSSSSLTYTYDPKNPVPTVGGANLFLPCGPMAQNSVLNRSDVLVFSTAVLDEPIALVGNIVVTLYVSSSANDTDFTVKVMDTFPDGTAALVVDDILRMRWRNGPSPQPELMIPGQLYEISIEMWYTSLIVNAGHRLSLAVSSSNYPRFSVNPNTGLPLAVPSSTSVIAQNTLYLGGDTPSSISLPLVAMQDIPANVRVPL